MSVEKEERKAVDHQLPVPPIHPVDTYPSGHITPTVATFRSLWCKERQYITIIIKIKIIEYVSAPTASIAYVT